MSNAPLSPEDLERYQARLQALIQEHRDLDQVILHLADNPPPDQLLVPRLKKRKLQLRDQIWQIEALLAPDEPA
ncbi:YdcH family protein [Azovibrio restrictus]|uniref:YdcH family protein n=1 Tax=Azovibrio restrictus TaxID=146938 RepID=UPI0026EB049B|nr:YdcH family protein [Azovibrio restrictus]